jgi:integrase
VSAFLDRYLEAAAKPRVAPRTYADYERLYDRYVRPVIGMLYLDSVTPLVVQELYQGWLDRGASADAVKRIHAVLRPAFKQAVRWRLLATNPCLDVEVPRWHKREVRSLDRDEAARFLRAAADQPQGLLFEVMLATGMRPGEVLGLRWSDCDLETPKLAVRQALVRLPDGDWRLEPPKTRKSRRGIPIPLGLSARLASHRREQATSRLQHGPAWQGHDLVFCGRYGQPLDWHNLSQRAFKEILASAELPREIRPYDLRHTCASLLLQAGEPVKVVAERLGHSTTTLTLDVYAHVLPGMQEQATATLQTLLYEGGE